jgi:hypothetical protein
MTHCKFPHNAPRTGYNKGCRCRRCTTEKVAQVTASKSPEQEKQRRKRKYTKNCAYVDSLKVSCADCGWNNHPTLLEFHHTVISENNRSPKQWRNKKAIDLELTKGVFLCPTCHRLRHFNHEKNLVETSNRALNAHQTGSLPPNKSEDRTNPLREPV